MTSFGWIEILAYLGLLIALVRPLGEYMARVYSGVPMAIDRILHPVEQLLYRLCRVDPAEEMTWKTYTAAMLLFQGVGLLAVFGLQEIQQLLPLNPEHLGRVSFDSAFNTAVSFVTNTNWQGYSGETTLSYLTQMAALTVQNFVSAATGMAVLVAFLRGFKRKTTDRIGNFWVDLVRSTLHILLPLALLLALLLVSQGVVQTFHPYARAALLDPPPAAKNPPEGTRQILALGPAASQVAIKQLGTNGGGFFNVNSSHPFENPTPISDFLELLAILLIPAALCYTFGRLVGDVRQGIAVLAAMLIIFVPLLAGTVFAEQSPHPGLKALNVDVSTGGLQSGGNMEGKEVRFGIAASSLWAVATTAASNGSVNSMHDSFTPLGGLYPMWLMQLGEVIFGGVGSGLYGMLLFAIVGVFVAGLMVGRTPEYLGKKIEAFEMKMASIAILAPAAAVLIGTALAVATGPGKTGAFNPGPHGFSEILYAFSSTSNNNGSAFAGIGADTPFYNITLGVAMLIGRYAVAVPVLAIAGSLARKKTIPAGSGTLPTHGPLFVGLLVGVVILVGALTFVPALALGPVIEQLRMTGGTW
jgi:potassium-transporting ATPase potassium-binding subunit